MPSNATLHPCTRRRLPPSAPADAAARGTCGISALNVPLTAGPPPRLGSPTPDLSTCEL
ncbi:hypothetical protein FKM82_007506 [Ascaphus truei]